MKKLIILLFIPMLLFAQAGSTKKQTYVGMVNVMLDKYKAKGDGVTDDLQALQSAFEKENNIYLTSGTTFIISAPLIIYSNVVVQGGGKIKASSSFVGTNLIEVHDSVGLYSIALDGSSRASNLIKCVNSKGVRVEGGKFYNYDKAIDISNKTTIFVKENYFYGGQTADIYSDGTDTLSLLGNIYTDKYLYLQSSVLLNYEITTGLDDGISDTVIVHRTDINANKDSVISHNSRIAAVEGGTLQTLNDGKIFIGGVTNIPVERTMFGDGSIDRVGNFQLGSGVVTNNDIQSNASISPTKIEANTVGLIDASEFSSLDGMGGRNISDEIAGINTGTGFVSSTGVQTITNEITHNSGSNIHKKEVAFTIEPYSQISEPLLADRKVGMFTTYEGTRAGEFTIWQYDESLDLVPHVYIDELLIDAKQDSLIRFGEPVLTDNDTLDFLDSDAMHKLEITLNGLNTYYFKNYENSTSYLLEITASSVHDFVFKVIDSNGNLGNIDLWYQKPGKPTSWDGRTYISFSYIDSGNMRVDYAQYIIDE